MSSGDNRKISHRRNDRLEHVLSEMNAMLEKADTSVHEVSEHKKVFIVGCARSGSTLLYQFLSQHLEVCFPTNFLSRFYANPYLGALAQVVMTDLDTKHELLADHVKDFSYQSQLGKTTGVLSPHEFWYFWRRYFDFSDIQKLSDSEIDAVDWKGFNNSLNGLQAVFQRPLLMKAMIVNWNLLSLVERVPNAHVIYIRRDVADNAASIYKARNEFFGDVAQWYSFKPPEYPQLVSRSPEEQVVGQVICTNQAIEEQLSKMSKQAYSVIDYEAFCDDPLGFLSSLSLSTGIELKAGAEPINFLREDKPSEIKTSMKAIADGFSI